MFFKSKSLCVIPFALSCVINFAKEVFKTIELNVPFGFHAAQIFSDIGRCIFSSPKHKVLVSYWYQSLSAGNVFDLIKSRLYNNDVHLSFGPFVCPYINILSIAYISRKMYVVYTSNFIHIDKAFQMRLCLVTSTFHLGYTTTCFLIIQLL